jgi:hypothetical protein
MSIFFQSVVQKGTEKHGNLVWDDAPWDPKVHPNLLKEDVLFIVSYDGFFKRNKNAHLVEHANYQKNIVMSLPSC